MMREIVLLSTLIAFLLSSCSAAPTAPSPTESGPTPPPESFNRIQKGFAEYQAVPVNLVLNAPQAAPYIAQISNPELIEFLNDAQRAALESNGFVVVPESYTQIYGLYKAANSAGVPVFVTTDSLLHAFHILYDFSLRLAEKDHFIADLEALTAALLTESETTYQAASGLVQEAAYQNVAFFAVAARLLNPDAELPKMVRDVAEQELTLIENHAGLAASPIFGYPEDYSQYVPRGHYTRNEDFERYFRTMMWYGRIGFRLTTPDDPAIAERETRSALLIARMLDQGAAGQDLFTLWDKIYEPTVFFVGAADDLTVYDYGEAANTIYGGLPSPQMLNDDAALQSFMTAARQLRAPRIVSGEVPDYENPEVTTQAFRFMGQRYIPDSYIFQQLVYNKVGLYLGQNQPFTFSFSDAGPIRGFPRGLDVPAVLGSARALEILNVEGDTDYQGYDEQFDKLKVEFESLPESQWSANLYWSWLNSLLPLLDSKGEGYPYFMQQTAWIDKDLHTWLGSWAELRHDTILYAKQSYTIRATTALVPEFKPPPGYVEPQPEVYARLAALSDQMLRGLDGRGLLNEEIGDRLNSMKDLLLRLTNISQKELAGENLSEDEYSLLRNIGSRLEYLTTFSEEIEGEITSQADDQIALIADVHTDVNTEQVLEEAIGDAYSIYVMVSIEGQSIVTKGGVFSYYEFKWPMSDRLTDEAWQALSPRPDQPDWTGSFIQP